MSAPPRRLRVAHVTHGFDVGGLEKLLVELARHADRSRFDLHFVSLGERGLLAGDVEAVGWPVHTLHTPHGFRPRLILRLAQLFRRLRIDVVHTHDDRPHLHASPAARLVGIRRIIHTRHHQGFHLTPRQHRLVALVARCIEHFVCVSQHSARQAAEHGVPTARLCSIPNGIDVQRFANGGPRRTGPAVIVARLSPEKDVATLLRAVDLVRRTDPAFRLEIAGDGPCRPELERLAAQLGLAEHVRFLGQVREVPALLARARLFVLSSLFEGISLTLLEAMASGLAIVATQSGGNPEVVADGATGLLVPAADPEALAGGLLRLWGDDDLRDRLGAAGRERAEQHFDIRVMVAAYERLYTGVNGVYTAALPAAACRR
jgi:glycosyltransferase involved in cell wall biosynthesis